jgi:hypothetical protein
VHETDPTYFIQKDGTPPSDNFPDGTIPSENFVIEEGIGAYIIQPYDQFKDPSDLKFLLPANFRKTLEGIEGEEESEAIEGRLCC